MLASSADPAISARPSAVERPWRRLHVLRAAGGGQAPARLVDRPGVEVAGDTRAPSERDPGLGEEPEPQPASIAAPAGRASMTSRHIAVVA